MDALRKILDDTLQNSLYTRPEIKWLQEKYDIFMRKNGLTSKL